MIDLKPVFLDGSEIHLQTSVGIIHEQLNIVASSISQFEFLAMRQIFSREFSILANHLLLEQ